MCLIFCVLKNMVYGILYIMVWMNEWYNGLINERMMVQWMNDIMVLWMNDIIVQWLINNGLINE